MRDRYSKANFIHAITNFEAVPDLMQVLLWHGHRCS